MFTNTLSSTWEERSRRGLTALSSFGVQALIAGVLLVLPLLRPSGLPSLRPLSTPISLGQPLGEAPVRARTNGSAAAPNNPAVITLTMPTRIPSSIPDAGDEWCATRCTAWFYFRGHSRGRSPRHSQLVWRYSRSYAGSCGSAGSCSDPHLAHERGRSGSQGSADVSPAGAERAHSRAGRLASRDQQARGDSEP